MTRMSDHYDAHCSQWNDPIREWGLPANLLQPLPPAGPTLDRPLSLDWGQVAGQTPCGPSSLLALPWICPPHPDQLTAPLPSQLCPWSPPTQKGAGQPSVAPRPGQPNTWWAPNTPIGLRPLSHPALPLIGSPTMIRGRASLPKHPWPSPRPLDLIGPSTPIRSRAGQSTSQNPSPWLAPPPHGLPLPQSALSPSPQLVLPLITSFTPIRDGVSWPTYCSPSPCLTPPYIDPPPLWSVVGQAIPLAHSPSPGAAPPSQYACGSSPQPALLPIAPTPIRWGACWPTAYCPSPWLAPTSIGSPPQYGAWPASQSPMTPPPS